jgi:hypothetical protein
MRFSVEDAVSFVVEPEGIYAGINPLFPRLRSGHPLFQRPSPKKQIPSIEALDEARTAAEPLIGVLFAGPMPTPAEFRKKIPAANIQAFMGVASSFISSGVDTPAKFADAITKIGAQYGKDFTGYSDSLWADSSG